MAGKALLVAVVVACAIVVLAVPEEAVVENGNDLELSSDTINIKYPATERKHHAGESNAKKEVIASSTRIPRAVGLLVDVCTVNTCTYDSDCPYPFDIKCLCSSDLPIPEVPPGTCYDPDFYVHVVDVCTLDKCTFDSDCPYGNQCLCSSDLPIPQVPSDTCYDPNMYS